VVASSRRKALVFLHGILQHARKVYGLARKPGQAEVSDSIHVRRFCLIALSGRLPCELECAGR
jgi:hypothetical protein